MAEPFKNLIGARVVITGRGDVPMMGFAVHMRDNVLMPVRAMCPMGMGDRCHRQRRDGKTEQGSQDVAVHLIESYVTRPNDATEEYLNASSDCRAHAH